MMRHERILSDGLEHRSCAMLVAGVILHYSCGLCTATAELLIERVNALLM